MNVEVRVGGGSRVRLQSTTKAAEFRDELHTHDNFFDLRDLFRQISHTKHEICEKGDGVSSGKYMHKRARTVPAFVLKLSE